MMDGEPNSRSQSFNDFAEETRVMITRPKFPFERLSSIRPKLHGEYLIKGLLSSSGLTVIFGAPGSGKSFVAGAAGMHVAAGVSWAGRKVRQVGVVYIAAEGQTGFRKRIYGALREFGFSVDIPFVLITVAPNLGAAEGDVAVLIREIAEQSSMIGFQVGLVIVDTLSRTIVGADENSGRDMGIFVSNVDAIGRQLKATVIAVHHTGKDLERGMRGSSALHGATDGEWEISSENGIRTLRIAKMKDADDQCSAMFRLRVVEVGIDEDGDPVTTCVAEVSDQPEHRNVPPSQPQKQVTGQRAEFLKAVALAIDAFGQAMPASDYTPSNRKGVQRQKLAAYAEQLGFTEGATPEARKTVRNRLIRTLAGDKLLGQWGEWIWLP